MKNLLLTLLGFFAFAIVLSACSGGTAVKEEIADAAETMETEASEAADKVVEAVEELATGVLISTDAYTTNVLETGIASPRKEMTGKVDGVDITVNYGSPYQKGRTLWGDLIASDRTWRTGANATTTLTVSENITLGGVALPAGTYSIFSIQGADQVTVIINKDTEAGEGSYDASKDAFRFNVAPTMSETASESLEFMIEGNNLVFAWGKRRVAMPIAKG